MHSRCYNLNEPCHAHYGAKGVYICDGWIKDFGAFRDDMGPRPSKQYSIDRINNDGSYTCGKCSQCVERGAPANCRWATDEQQANNQSRTRLLTHDGVTMSLSQWARHLGWHPNVLYTRFNLGWTVEQALTTPRLRQGPGTGNTLQYAVKRGIANAATESDARSVSTKQRRPNPRKSRAYYKSLAAVESPAD
jgi:hypothetical protein